MANWKKMAEAFGRAMHRPNTSSKLASETFDRATKAGAADDYLEGASKGFEDELKLHKSDDYTTNAYDNKTDKLTDEALQKDFDEAFEAALAKRRGKILEAMGDARGAEEAADAGIDDIRKAAIEMLKSGRDIGDVIRILKGE